MFTYKTATYGKKNKRVVFLLSGWGFDRRFFSPIAYILVFAGYQCIVYSYDASILSPDINKTVARFNLVKNEILSTIQDCKNHGDQPYAIFGTSLGAILALMVIDETPECKKVILNLVGADIAEIIWSWDIVKPWFKKVLQTAGITVEKLKSTWQEISPINNSDKINDRKVLLYLSRKDQVIPYEQGKKLEAKFKEQHTHYTLIENTKLKHVSAAAWNLINFPRYIKFLKNSK